MWKWIFSAKQHLMSVTGITMIQLTNWFRCDADKFSNFIILNLLRSNARRRILRIKNVPYSNKASFSVIMFIFCNSRLIFRGKCLTAPLNVPLNSWKWANKVRSTRLLSLSPLAISQSLTLCPIIHTFFIALIFNTSILWWGVCLNNIFFKFIYVFNICIIPNREVQSEPPTVRR